MAKIRQLLLLIWKDFKLQFRHPWVTLLELGVPAFFSICLIFIRTAITSDFVPEPTIYAEFGIDSIPKNLTPSYVKRHFEFEWEIIYSPKGQILDQVMDRVAKSLKVKIRGFDSEDKMLQYYNNATSQIISGIVFDEALKHDFNHTQNLGFKVRPMKPYTPPTPGVVPNWQTEFVFPMFQALGPRNKDSAWGGAPGYMSQGFLPVQHAVAMSLIENIPSNISIKSELEVLMQRYPYPPFLDDKFILALQLFFPMIVCFSFIYPALNIVKNLVIEKEKKLKEAMKMMGLSSWLHWTAWYLKYFLFLCISVAIITVLLTTKFEDNIAVVNYSNPSVIYVWFILYTACTISFCFFISTLFSKANSSAAGTGVIFFLTFVPYFFISTRYKQLSLAEKLGSCILPNTALAMGSIVLTMWEGTGSGLQWKLLHLTASPDDSLTMNMIFMMLFFDAIFYLILTWYVEAVFPGEFGIPEPWYFPFTRVYWCGTQSSYSDLEQLFNISVKSNEFFERDPDELMAGIQIQGLTKVYHKKKPPAVNSINVNMYRGQIMALLGHNGAGKTTTISMLTGLFPPSSGTAIVNGFDITEDISAVHSSLGICPQHDVLFDELTVEEHLYFFCKLKGYISDLVRTEIDRIITSIGLEDKRKSTAETLSGGMKRKLSVGIALVGGSRVVMLDEPTSGMDPSARRFIWDLLQSEKEDRTILLTTHFMEEADILGDRIAIMADGEIQCCGSPLFLKKKYGAGYHLVMVKQDSCDVSIVTKVIHSYVPNAEMANDIGTELKFILPHESSHLFQELFSELEKNKDVLKISSYGASITTMEEVFIKVGRKVSSIEHTIEVREKQTTSFSPTDSGIHVTEDMESCCSASTDTEIQNVKLQQEESNYGIHLFLQQLQALIKKRIFHTTRNQLLTLSQIGLPPFLLILTLLIIKSLPKPHDSIALKLSLDPFHGTEIPFASSDNALMENISNIFSSEFDGEVNRPILVNTSAQNMVSYLVEKGKNDIGDYNMHNIIGATFGDSKSADKKKQIIAFFNNQAFHSPAISLMAVHNALLKYVAQDTSYSFTVTNHPLPRSLFDKGRQQQMQTTEAYQISQDLIFGMAFLIASFAVFMVKERSSKSKHLQRVSGVNLFSYWLASFMWDFINYLFPCIFILLIFLVFDTKGFSSADQQGRLLLLLVLHGFSALPCVYCCTFLFKTPSTAYVRLSLFSILSGIACLLTVSILELPDIGEERIANPLDVTFSLLLPNYCLGRSVSNLYQNNQFNKLCNQPLVQDACQINDSVIFNLVKLCCKGKCGDECLPWEEDFLSWTNPGIGKQLAFLIFQSFFFTALLTMCELNFGRYLKYKLKGRKVTPLHEEPSDSRAVEDDDVTAERHKILQMPLSDLFASNHLVLKQLSKSYGSLLAVDKVTFGVKKGECFGLLGLNGAGKTTTFKMITGDESISSGDIYVNGYSIKNAARKVQRNLGYCPQFDALIDQLTGRETLTLFARLRGMSEKIIPTQVASLGDLLSFGVHIDKQVKEYSGGNKRKLSTAVALIGNPPVIFLDEPTTGMDPVSRRCVWNALLKVLKSGRSIILTSHSMEECEALCNRLVIMVNGRLCCLGSPQHLKNKFGQGFTLMIKVGRRYLSCNNPLTSLSSYQNFTSVSHQVSLKDDIEHAKAFVERTFHSAVLKDSHEGLLHYHIPNPQLNWSQIFGAMEQARSNLNIEDYSVGQTTLEQVFLNFAMMQRVDHDN